MKRSPLLVGLVALAAGGLWPRRAAAEVVNDGELWVELGVRLEPHRRLRLSLDEQLRADDGMSRPRTLLSELALTYTPRRWLRLGAGYRLESTKDHEGRGRRRHRWNLDVGTRHRLGPIVLGGRLRFQEESRVEADDGAPWRHVLRGRLELGLRRFPVFAPSLEVEVFLRLADAGVAVALYQVRTTVGVELDTRAGSPSLAYRLDVELSEPVRLAHILFLRWHFDIDLDAR